MSSQLKALEVFDADADLLRLESLLSKFNLFEAIGVVRQELRHSNLLAFLLNPSQSHSLGAVFLKELLQSVLLQTEVESAVSSSDLDSWNLDAATVQREWHHIDILVIDDVNRFAVIIENKVDTGERSDQLNRYYKDVRSHYPGHKVVALYLTPDGDSPTSDRYHAVSYTQVCLVVERLVALRRSTLGSDVVMLLEHYAQMLRRHIVSDSDIAGLCRSIYQKHRQALDLIFKHQPDPQTQISECVRALIAQEPSLRPHNFGRGYINFGLREWDVAPAQHRIEHEDGRWLPYLAATHFLDGLSVGLWVAPGIDENREKLLQMARQHQLTGFSRRLTGVWSRASAFHLLSTRDYNKTQDEIASAIAERWAEFMRDELPRIVRAVREEEWLWETHRNGYD